MRSLLIIVIFVLSANSFAYDRASEILLNCGANPGEGFEEAMKSLHCSGYLTGIVDGILMMQTASNQQYICLPSGYASGEQTLKSVTQWLQTNPEVANNDSARIAVLKALLAIYPCAQ